MQPLPHRYVVTATAPAGDDVSLQAAGLPELRSAGPPEFGGPGNLWSPETLVVAAVADCFILTFRALARRYGLPWTLLTCETSGTLDRIERVTQFSAFHSRVQLHVPLSASKEEASHLLALAEEKCLITNSLKARMRFDADIFVTAGSDVIATVGMGRHDAR